MNDGQKVEANLKYRGKENMLLKRMNGSCITAPGRDRVKNNIKATKQK